MLQVSAIQLNCPPTHSPQLHFDHTRELIERASVNGARLVVSPNTSLSIPRAEYIDFFSALARRLQIFLAPGTIIDRDGNALYNTAYLFAPDGKVVGTQRQTHRTPQEIAQGWAQGDELYVFDISIGRIGFVIGSDVEYPEVSRILALQGANVLIHSASYTTWSKEHFLIDLWREVQSNQVFGVQACLAGAGQSAIYAPVEMTPDHRGFLAQASNVDAEVIVSASLDFDALQKVMDDYPIFDFFNHEFYARAFQDVYRI
jgi:predicted amidohydrolase